MTQTHSHDKTRHLEWMTAAARIALRGHGYVEPNPMVGCVIIDQQGRLVGQGFHQRFGGPHAEVSALAQAREAARGATAYVTLEPCDHHGKTGPCTQALIEAGIVHVVIGRADPNPTAAGGSAALAQAGVKTTLLDEPNIAWPTTDPFAHRVTTGLPWLIAKWAQTIDGRIATRTGHSKWISSERSRRCVHRQRGRVDAILTGIGTVLADDPQLTARGVRVRRIARRVVIDPKLQTPLDSALVRTIDVAPLSIACTQSLIDAGDPRAAELQSRGVEMLGIPLDETDGLAIEPVLRALVERHDVTNLLVEAGGGLLGKLFQQRLVCQAWVFIAPMLLGDDQAISAVRGVHTPTLDEALCFNQRDLRTRGGDIMALWRV